MIHEIVAFVRVVSQVVEFVGAVGIAVDVFPIGCANHARGAVFVVDDDIVAGGISFAFERGEKGLTGIGAAFGQGQAEVVEQGGHKIVSRCHSGLRDACGNHPGMTRQKRHFDGVFVHVQGPRAIALAPKPVMPTGKAIVRREDDEGVVANPLGFDFVEDAPHVGVHRRDSGKITLEAFAVAQILAQATGPRVRVFLWAGFKRAVVVRIHDVLGVPGPWAVRRGVVNAEVKGIVVFGVRVDECQGVIRDRSGDVPRHGDEFAVANQFGVVVWPPALFVGKPMREPVLCQSAVAQMPLPGQATRIAVRG